MVPGPIVEGGQQVLADGGVPDPFGGRGGFESADVDPVLLKRGRIGNPRLDRAVGVIRPADEPQADLVEACSHVQVRQEPAHARLLFGGPRLFRERLDVLCRRARLGPFPLIAEQRRLGQHGVDFALEFRQPRRPIARHPAHVARNHADDRDQHHRHKGRARQRPLVT